MNLDDKKQQKKPYHAPVIEAYGDVAAITKSIGGTGAPDSGKGQRKATAP